MTLLIGLQLPVFSYCAAEQTVFVGQHTIEADCHDECGHDSAPIEIPCEEDHEFLTVDAGDFQWNSLTQPAPPVALIPEDFSWVSLFFISEKKDLPVIMSLVDPPPPDLPIFRRDAALRL